MAFTFKLPSPSNKAQTLAKGPFIDKLSMVLSPDEVMGKDLHAAIYVALTTDKAFYQQAAKPISGFKLAKMIALPGVEDRPRVDYRWAHGVATGLRLEINPTKLGSESLVVLKAVVDTWLDGGWAAFVENANVSRIDVAIDLPTFRMDQVLHLPNQAATAMQYKFTVGGHPQSIYHGTQNGNQTVIYSKKQEQLSKPKSVWSGKSVLRVERRLRNTKLKAAELSNLANPFAVTTLTTALPPPPDTNEADAWAMFGDSVAVRGLESALALLTIKRRTAYRKYLKTHQHALWDPQLIWEGWPAHLKDLAW